MLLHFLNNKMLYIEETLTRVIRTGSDAGIGGSIKRGSGGTP